MNMGGEYCGKYRILNTKLMLRIEDTENDYALENPIIV
jgi:hypothetical protein